MKWRLLIPGGQWSCRPDTDHGEHGTLLPLALKFVPNSRAVQSWTPFLILSVNTGLTGSQTRLENQHFRGLWSGLTPGRGQFQPGTGSCLDPHSCPLKMDADLTLHLEFPFGYAVRSWSQPGPDFGLCRVADMISTSSPALPTAASCAPYATGFSRGQ